MPNQVNSGGNAMSRSLLLCALTALQGGLAHPRIAVGQSDSSNFATVINIPPDPAPGSIGASTQVNLRDGGEISRDSGILAGGELNIYGGSVGDSFNAGNGSAVNIRGGTVGLDFDALLGSNVQLVGGEFRLNGAPFAQDLISLTSSDVFTGSFEDGSSFIFSPLSAETFEGVRLTTSPLPAIDTTPIVLSSLHPTGPAGLRAGQTLTLRSGGRLGPTFAVVDAALNIEGGAVDTAIEVAGGLLNVKQGTVGRVLAYSGSVVNISGGSVAPTSRAFSGSEVNISGGTVGTRFEAAAGSVVNVSGGSVESGFEIKSESEVNVAGGTVSALSTEPNSVVNVSGGLFRAGNVYASEINLTGGALGIRMNINSGSTVNISGGRVGYDFVLRSGSVATISGGAFGRSFNGGFRGEGGFVGNEFKLNGLDYNEASVLLGAGDVFSGTLADGSAFIFSYATGDRLFDAPLTATSLPAPDLTPKLLISSSSPPPKGLRSGQSLTVQAAGRLPSDFSAIDSTLTINNGGTVDEGLEVENSVVNINGGSVGNYFAAFGDSVVSVRGGTVGMESRVDTGSVLNVSSGVVGAGLTAGVDSVVNISGGSISRTFRAGAGSEVHLFGTEFFLDGVSLDNQAGSQTVVISARNVTLTGSLLDGSGFSFLLTTRGGTSNGYFDTNSLLTVNFVRPVPEPQSLPLLAIALCMFVGFWRAVRA